MEVSVRSSGLKQKSKSADGYHITNDSSKANFFKKSARTLAILLFVGEMGFILLPGSSKAQSSPSDSLSDNLSTQPASIGVSQPVANSSNTNVSNTNSSNTSSTNVNVNGQSVAVPANGSTQQIITDGNTNTSINVSHSSSNTSGSNSSSLNVQINSQSESGGSPM
jgi:hypothetical protein